MKPQIDGTDFGGIVIDGERYDHDVVIRLSGDVKKRKKRLSKEVFGTSHRVSLDEAKHIYDEGALHVIIGSGQYGALDVSKEAQEYFLRKGCEVTVAPTPEAVKSWNDAKGKVVAMFHVTC